MAPQLLVLSDRHLLKTHEHRRIGLLELLSEGVKILLFLLFTLHRFLTYLAKAASSSSTPGLIVKARFTFFMYLPLAVEGFALTTASIKARVFSAILFSSKETLPTATVNHPSLVDAILDFAGLGFLDGSFDVESDRARLRIRHQSARAEHLTETAHQAHHIGRRDHRVKVEPAAFDFGDHVFAADEICACLFGFFDLVALRDHQNRF